MLSTIIQDMDRTIVQRDGPTLGDFLQHLAESALNTLRQPSDAVLEAGAVELAKAYEAGEPIGYQTAGRVFVAMITKAGEQ